MSDACHTAVLSYLQQRVWQRTQTDPTTLTYNLPIAFRLRGCLHADALERAFGAVVQRHEALRTVFRNIGGEVRQIVLPDLAVRMSRSIAPADDPGSFIQERLTADANQPFSLENGPLLRVGLIRVAPSEHVLFLTVHHIVSDGWSAEVLFKEVSTIYDALAADTEPVLPPAYPFRNYASTQHAWLQSDEPLRQLIYWSERLRGAEPVLDLPAPDNSPRQDRLPATRHSFAIADDIRRPVTATARMYQVTPFVVMLAAFKVLLWRYTAREDICVASWVAGRRRVEWEHMIGLVRNAVIIRTMVRAEDTCASVISRVGDGLFEACEHQDVPLEQVLSRVAGPAMDTWRKRLVWFSGGRWRLLELTGVEVTFLPTAPTTAGRYLSLAVNQRVGRGPERWAGHVEFNPWLVDSASMAMMVGDFHRVVAQMCQYPMNTVGDLVAAMPRDGLHAHAVQ